MELRDKIADLLWGSGAWGGTSEHAERLADAILAIPELQEALRYRNVVLASRLPDLPPDRVGEIIRDLANRVAD